jgi:hypothetical protein
MNWKGDLEIEGGQRREVVVMRRERGWGLG